MLGSLRLLGCLGLAGWCVLLAQDATVTGIVTDPAAAVVPGVSIKLRNTDTNITRSIQTNQEGNYAITNLPPGKYELAAEVQGFHGYRQSGIQLEVGQTLRADIRLTIGSLADTIHVVAEIAALNTENGVIKGDVIVQQEIADLPLEGRDFTDLAFLVPGVFPAAQGSQGSAMAINGARADSTNFYVDGFNNRNAKGAAAQVRPNMSAMQEFKMEVGGFSAEYGRMAGGILNMVLRSGTNQYHGDIFHYVRNNLIDARAFFDREKLKLNRHQFGATLAGPLRIPRLYDGGNRTFFMFSWESYRQIVGSTGISHVPTALERNGIFTESLNQTGKPVTVKDPLGGNAAFPGNRIPASRFHPTALNAMAYYPLPNRADRRNNFITSANDQDSWDSYVAKVDHRFNESNSLSYRFQARFNDVGNPFDNGNLGIFGKRDDDHRSLMGVDFTHLFTAAFLVEAHSGFSRSREFDKSVWAGQDMAAKLGLAGSTTEPELIGFPRVNVLDYVNLGSSSNLPVEFFVTDIQNGAKFTWVKSRHVLKWGFEHSRVRYNQPYFNNNRGSYIFQDRWTGHSMGDFLLGTLNNSTRTVGWNRNYQRATSMGGFFNDDFKLRANLTLNLGLRYELNLPAYDRYDRMSNFVPGLGKIIVASRAPDVVATVARANLQQVVGFASDVGLPRSLVRGDYTNLAPRAGFAWRPGNKTKMVVRGGYGIFYTGALLNPIRNDLQNSFPYLTTESYSRNSSRPDLLTLSTPFPTDRLTVGGTDTSKGYETDPATGYLQSYNLTLERDLGGGAALEIGYAGSKGTHLGRQYDINQPRRSMAAYLAGTPTASLRPYPFLSGSIDYYTFGVNSIYNSGQLSIRKRGRSGMFYRFNYIYSKSIDNASQISGNSDGGFSGAQDPNNFKAERARSDWDAGHIATLAFSYPLPLGRGRQFLAKAGGFAQTLLGGWQFAGTGSFATGSPITVTSADVDQNLGESSRPNRLGTGIPEAIAGQRRGVDYPWFILDDFEKVPRCASVAEGCAPSPHGFMPFRFGNSGRNILDGPGRAYFNMSMMKNFRFGEGRKTVQFRFESFNVLNHPNFRLPNNTFNATAGGLITSVQDTGRGGSRVFQASLKFQF